MTKSTKILAFLFLVIGLTSCEKLIKIDVEGATGKLVVEGEISQELKPWAVRLSQSQAYYNQNSPSEISTAVVSISDNQGNIESLIYDSDGWFISAGPKQCVPGLSYTLTVDYDGSIYEATEKCRNQYPLDTIAAYYLPEENGFIDSGWYAFQKASEWEEPGDYYEWKLYRNDTLLDGFGFIIDTDEFIEQGADAFFNLNIDPVDPLAGFPDVIPRPFPFKLNFKDTFRVEQYCINKEYADYLLEVQNQLNRQGTPFDPPPANPINNITNLTNSERNALGYFSVVNVVGGQIIIGE